MTSVLLHISLSNSIPTYETEALLFYSKPQLLKRLLQLKERLIWPCLGPSWQVFTTCFVIKVTPTNCTTSNCGIVMALNLLAHHNGSISHHITPLVIYNLGGGLTDRQTIWYTFQKVSMYIKPINFVGVQSFEN